MSRKTSHISTFSAIPKIPLRLTSFALSVLLAYFSIVPKVMATGCNPGQAGFQLSDCYFLNANTQTTVGSVYDKPVVLVNLLTRNIFIVGGFIIFILIMYSGYLFISGGTKGQEQSKEVMTTAVAGFAIMFAAYWILQIIKIITGADIGF